MKKINNGFFIAAIILLSSCNQQETDIIRTDRYQIVKQTIESSIGWAKEKDFKLLYSIIVNDSSYLEVQPGRRVVRGFEDFKKAEKFWKSPDFKAIKYEIRDLTINFSKSGDTAWWYCILDDINEWQGKPANWENTRWTGVLEKQDGIWKIVQMHFSFARE